MAADAPGAAALEPRRGAGTLAARPITGAVMKTWWWKLASFFGVAIFWLRELAGWTLILLGLWVFYLTLDVLYRPAPYLLQAIFMTVIGVLVFRGGVQMLKLAVAGRVCLRAQARLSEEERAREHKPVRRTLAVEGRPAKLEPGR